jgi:glycopeptide antibiotics resistance protein
MTTANKRSNIKKLFYTWAFYFFIIVMAITLSPYNFDFSNKSTFSWTINTIDMFENLFLLFPIGFFLALSSDKLKPITFIKYIAIGFIFSFFIEFSQLFLKSRVSQYWDVIANTISIILGALVAALLKPLTHKWVIKQSSIALLISTLFALSILLILRLMMNNQGVGLFEYCLLLCSSGILILIFSHYSRKNNHLSASKSSVIGILFLFISLFPLLFTDLTLLLVLSLLFGLIVPAGVYLMHFIQSISHSNKKMVIFIIIYLPIIVFSGLALTNLLTTKVGFSIFELDKLYTINDGRGVGGVIVQALLLLAISFQLLSYALPSKKAI